jgi:hypothetical protein
METGGRPTHSDTAGLPIDWARDRGEIPKPRTEYETISVKKVSLWFHDQPQMHDAGTVDVAKITGEAFLLGVSGSEWPVNDRCWATVTFETKNGDRFRYWGYLHFWPLP